MVNLLQDLRQQRQRCVVFCPLYVLERVAPAELPEHCLTVFVEGENGQRCESFGMFHAFIEACDVFAAEPLELFGLLRAVALDHPL